MPFVATAFIFALIRALRGYQNSETMRRKVCIILLWLGLAVTTKTAQTVPRPALLIQSGHQQAISALAVSPDNKTVTTISPDRTARLWEIATGRELRVWQLNITPQNLAYSTDGKFVRSGAQAWEVISGKEVTVFGRSFLPFSVSLGPGTYGKITLASTTQGILTLRTATNPAQPIMRATLNADGTRLASEIGGDKRQIQVWDTTQGQLLFTADDVRQAIFSTDGKLLAGVSGANQTAIVVLNLATQQRQQFGRKAVNSLAAAFSADGKAFAIATDNRQIKLWDLIGGREVGAFGILDAPVKALAFSPDGTKLAAVDALGVRLYDVTTGRKLFDFNRGALLPVPFVAFSPDGAKLAVSDATRQIIVYATDDGRKLVSLAAEVSTENAPGFVSDNLLLTQNADGVPRLWDTTTGQMMQALPQLPRGAWSIAANGRVAIQDTNTATGQLWDVVRPRKLKTWRNLPAQHLTLNRTGDLIAATSNAGRTQLYDLERGRVRATFNAATDAPPAFTVFSADSQLIATAESVGPVALRTVTDGSILLNLVNLTGSDWLAVTPDSYFDGSPPAWNLVLWRYDEDTFNVAPVEWFFTEFFYPAILADIAQGRRPRAPSDFALKDRRQPVLKLTLIPPDAKTPNPPRTVKVRLEIADASPDKTSPQGCGAQDVRLLRNGALVKVWRGDVLQGQSNRVLETEVRITSGPNELLVYGFNRDNVKSKNVVLQVNDANTLAQKGTARIVSIGVNEYANRAYNLKYAVADAQLFAEEIKRQMERTGRFAKVEAVTLLDRDATKANMLNALRELARNAAPEDVVFVYFAGHGTAQGDRFYLIPHDLGYRGRRDALDEAGVQTILKQSVSDDELQDAFEPIDASRLVLILDACNSGQALEAAEKRRGPMNVRGLAQLAYEKGMFVLTASQGYQAALEVAELGHGLFTYALITEGLQQFAADLAPTDGTIGAREWFDYTTARVPVMQTEKLRRARQLGLNISFSGQTPPPSLRPQQMPVIREAQRPRLFYRRELENVPFVIANAPQEK